MIVPTATILMDLYKKITLLIKDIYRNDTVRKAFFMCLRFVGDTDHLILFVYKVKQFHSFNIPKQKHSALAKCLCLAPEVGFEPTANALTAHCSTAELLRNIIVFRPA